MKRKELIKRIRVFAKGNGFEVQVREGGNHTLITVGERRSVIPRHREINEITASAIMKQLGMK